MGPYQVTIVIHGIDAEGHAQTLLQESYGPDVGAMRRGLSQVAARLERGQISLALPREHGRPREDRTAEKINTELCRLGWSRVSAPDEERWLDAFPCTEPHLVRIEAGEGDGVCALGEPLLATLRGLPAGATWTTVWGAVQQHREEEE